MTVALRVPTVLGLNVTVIVHDAWAAMLVPQLLVCVKSPAAVPVIPMRVTLRAEGPVFDTVVTFGVLLLPVRTVPIWRELGTSFTVPVEMVMEAPADLAPSVTDVAVKIAIGEAGNVAGAMATVEAPLAVVGGM